MGPWEIAYRIKYDYPFAKLSGKYPGTRISMWCLWEKEMIHVPLENEDVIIEVESLAREIGRAMESYKPASNGFVLTLKCTCDVLHGVWDVSGKNNVLDIDPAVFLDGWGYHRVISFDEEDTRRFFSELDTIGTTELISKRSLNQDTIPSMVRIESFFAGMTEKQMDSLIRAYEYGYYVSPREITTDSIARSMGISRSTYEEHLRKAENRIMEAAIPYLKLFRAGGRKPAESLSPRVPVIEAG